MAKIQEPVQENSTQKEVAELIPIGTLKEKKKTSDPVFSGVCTMNGWHQGKMVSETEYDAAVKLFSTAPMGKG